MIVDPPSPASYGEVELRRSSKPLLSPVKHRPPRLFDLEVATAQCRVAQARSFKLLPTLCVLGALCGEDERRGDRIIPPLGGLCDTGLRPGVALARRRFDKVANVPFAACLPVESKDGPDRSKF
jgi:hypothetical protein